jgi:hypothetical protein
MASRRIGVGVHTEAEVQISFQDKTIKFVLLRFDNGKLDDSHSCHIDVPWQENQSLEELGHMVVAAGKQLGLIADTTQVDIVDMEIAVHYNRMF